MRARPLLFSVLFVSLALGSLPEISYARDKQVTKSAKSKRIKSKRNSKSKKAGSVSNGEIVDNPYPTENETDDVSETASDTGDNGHQGQARQGDTAPKASSSDGSLRRSNRMEFDERLVKGQAAKSGAVYLFKRTPRRLPGLVPMRRSYRKRIVEPVLGDQELKPAIFSKEDNSVLKLEKKKESVQPAVNQQNHKKIEKGENTNKKGDQLKKERKRGKRKHGAKK
ncbi:MAG: hypothetical protein GY847_37315 [Proteobacteria bacterium]|nr:hypothetical protein [Pseudomonadota bacterium]